MMTVGRLMIGRVALLLLLSGFAFITGCSGEAERDPEEMSNGEGASRNEGEGPDSTEINGKVHMPVLPGEYDPDREANQALLVGRVEIIDGCVRVVGGDDERGVLMIWPPETTIRADGSGGYEILDHNQELLVRVGDTIRMGGGTSDELGAVDPAIREQIEGFCEGPYWFAGHPLPREYW